MLTVTPSLAEYRYGDPLVAIPLFTATGATGTVHWSTSSGELSDATGATTSLTPWDRTEHVVITAEDDSDIVTESVEIKATIPYQPKWGVEIDLAPPTSHWPMVYEKRTFEEYWIMLQFFRWHEKALIETSEAEDGSLRLRVVRGKPFYVDDIASGVLSLVYFDSALRIAAQGPDWVDYAFQLVSYEYAIGDDPTSGPTRPLTGIPSILLEGGDHLLLEP